MILFPAIDLKDGKCVRLKLGDMATATVYNEDPGAQAKAFEEQGFSWLHVVDLNGAFEGQSVNTAAVGAILKATKNPVQLGGGIRSLPQIEDWLDRGLARVILGTVAVRDPELVKKACRLFPGRVAVGIDARGGKVAVEGWAEASELGVIELAKKFEGAGVAAIIYTDIDRDGVLTCINWESTIALADAVSIPVIASGGLASLDDIVRMTRPDARKLEGAVEVDHVQPGEALLLERLRLRGRILVVDGRRRHVAQLQPDALAVLQVDGGEEDHAVRRPRRRRSARSNRPPATSAQPGIRANGSNRAPVGRTRTR